MFVKVFCCSVLLVMTLTAQGGDSTQSEEGKVQQRPVVLHDGAQPGRWTMDLDAAKVLARKSGLAILLNFSGSDWCGYCKMVAREVFSTDEWADYAKDRFVLVMLDFPEDKTLVPEKYRSRNESMRQKYGIGGFPTFMVLDSDGEQTLGKFGISSDMSPPSFMKLAGSTLRYQPQQLARMKKYLGSKKGVLYQRQLARLAQNKSEFDAWLAAGPLKNEENTLKFNRYQEVLSEISTSIEDLELAALLKAFSQDVTSGQKNTALVDHASECVKVMQTLAGARQDLVSWLLARPALGKENSRRFTERMRRLERISMKLKEVIGDSYDAESGKGKSE